MVLLGYLQSIKGRAKTGPSFFALSFFSHIAENTCLGQAFLQKLADFSRPIHANQKNSQRMCETVGIAVVKPAPGKAEGRGKQKEQPQGFSVKTPVIKRVGGNTA